MDWKIFLDLIVSLLLAATIGYAVMLNNRLSSLRKNRDDLAKTIVAFNDATLRAESSIPKLKRAAEDAGAGLQERVEKAQSLRDDLAFMIERADTMANRLETSVRTARAENRAEGKGEARGAPAPRLSGGKSDGAAPKPESASRAEPRGMGAAPAAAADPDADDRSEAERELLRALQAMR